MRDAELIESTTETGSAPEPARAQSDAFVDSAILLAGAFVAAVGIGGYLFWALSGGLVREGNWIGVDFHTYYQAANVVRRGQDIYTAGISPPYVYPPLLAMLVVPLSLLPVEVATALWKLLQHVCLLGSGVLLVSMLPRRVRPLAAGVLLLGLLTVPVQDEIQVGESNSLVLLLVVGALWLVWRMEPNHGASPANWRAPLALYAGGLLALAASIKVLPVLVIAYFWWRGPRNVALVATVGFLALQGLTFVLTPSTADYWFTQFPGLFGLAFPYLDNQSINSVVARATIPGTDPTTPNMQVLDAEPLRPVLTWIANLLALGATILVLWVAGRRTADDSFRRAGDGRSPAGYGRATRLFLEVGLVLLTIHLVSGSTWLHHLVDLGVPVLGLVGFWILDFGFWSTESMGSNSAPKIQNPKSKIQNLFFGGGLGLILAALLHRPADWLNTANLVMPGSAPVALLASSMFTVVVMALWVWTAVTLLRRQAA